MICQNVVYEDSFDYRNNTLNESILDCLTKLDKIQTFCAEISEDIYYTDKLYEKEFIQGQLLYQWLYESDDENRDEKEFLLRIMQGWSRDEIKPIDNSIHVCLYKIVNIEKVGLAQGKNDWFFVRRTYLAKCETKADFFNGLQSCFPEICFSTTVENDLNTLSHFKNLIPEIVKHLEILNDKGLSLFKEHGERGALDRIRINGGFECSIEGDAQRTRQFLTFDFLSDTGDALQIKCSPHTKLVRADSDARIYFCWGHQAIGNGKKLLIGRIGTHPY